MILGESFILLTSFLFLKELEPVNLFPFNTVILSIAYLLVFCQSFDLFNLVSIKNNTSTSKMGVLILGISLYALLTVGGVVCSYILELTLVGAIWLQCVAFAPLLLSIVLSNISGTTTEGAIKQNDQRKQTLQQIQNIADELELITKCNSTSNQRIIQIENIKNQLKYITHSNNPKAKMIEIQLINTMMEMKNITTQTEEDVIKWNMAVEKCFNLIGLRKQQL